MKKFFEKFGAYIVAAIVFIALAYTYCKPELSGKQICGTDNVTARCAVQEYYAHDPAEGEYGFWNSSMFSGMPNYQIGGGHYKSDDLLNPLRSILQRGHRSGQAAWIILMYFVCFFIFLRSFDVDKWLCIAGAIAMALSSYFIVIIAAGHNGKTSTIALTTVVAAGLHLIFKKKYCLGAVLTLIASATGLMTHPQMAYYLFLMMGIFFLAEAYTHIKEKRYKDLAVGSAIFLCCVGIGVGANCSNVFVNTEYMHETMRGGHSDLQKVKDEAQGVKAKKGLDLDYATEWSYGIDETMSFLVPGFMGGASSQSVGRDSKLYKTMVKKGIPSRTAADFCENVPMYWGEQMFTSGNVYMGAIICFLFLLGCLIVRGPYKWAILAATLFSVALAWGHNFMPLTKLFFNVFPLYDKFRAVSSILIVAEITMPLLGFLAIKQIMDGGMDKKELGKKILISGGITAGICAFFALFGGLIFNFRSSYDAAYAGQLPSWLYSAIIDERAALQKSDCWRSFLLIAAGTAAVWLFSQQKIKKGWFVAVLSLLIVVDMWPVDKRYLNDSYFSTPKTNNAAYAIQPYEESILKDKDPHFRVMNLTTSTFSDARTSFRLKSIGGYSAAKLRRYQDLIDEHLSKRHLPVIGMLNAKYLIVSGEDGNPKPMLNPYALGNAWFVSEIKLAENAVQESALLDDIDLGTTAVTDKEFSAFVPDLKPGIAPDAEVHLTKFQPRYIDYECTSSKPGTIVFSEIYYPHGWNATIDGKPAEHFRANYTLRALNVPAGHHSIHFEFAPDAVRKGDTIATIFIVLMYTICAGIMALAIWRRVKKA